MGIFGVGLFFKATKQQLNKGETVLDENVLKLRLGFVECLELCKSNSSEKKMKKKEEEKRRSKATK